MYVRARFSLLPCAAVAVLLALLAGCSGSTYQTPRLNLPMTDRMRSTPLTQGVAETSLSIESAGNGSTSSRLLWMISYDTRDYEQVVSNCREGRTVEASSGSVATAECDGTRYDVIATQQQLELHRDGTLISAFSLPRYARVRASR